MAEAFLNQLLRIENRVQPHSSSSERCIATWLNPTGAAHNSCPLCRYVFFPARPRPYLEHGSFEDDERDGADSDGDDAAGPSDHYHNYAPWVPVNRRSDRREGSRGPEGDEDGGEMVGDSDEHEIANMVSPSPRPQANTHNDADEEMHERSINNEEAEEDSTRDPDLETTKIMCTTYCYRLDLTFHPHAIAIAHRFADEMRCWCRYVGHSPSAAAALAVRVASHLIRAPKSAETVHAMTGVDAEVIAGMDCPAWVRVGLMDEEIVGMMGREGRWAVRGLAPGSWFGR